MNTSNGQESASGDVAIPSAHLGGEEEGGGELGLRDGGMQDGRKGMSGEPAAKASSATGDTRTGQSRAPAGTPAVDDNKDRTAANDRKAQDKASPREAVSQWENTLRNVSNAHSGKCLADGDERTVLQAPCGATNTWQRLKVDDGVFLIRSVRVGACLDSNGERMYTSPCTADDPGQLWHMPSVGGCSVTFTSNQFGKYLTGWNTGTVSLVSADTADTAAKYTWSVSPSVAGSC
ncbi:hypothetical protein [Streptomyces sp. NPDC057052]|uniref:RICIN domain-containing protein n=1 Tax=Streptomyces sp. NPDC057052 TaxID=3346010 RepID=UPI0036364CC3